MSDTLADHIYYSSLFKKLVYILTVAKISIEDEINICIIFSAFLHLGFNTQKLYDGAMFN